LEDLPLSVGEVGGVAQWGHEDIRSSENKDARIVLRRPSETLKFLFAKLPLEGKFCELRL